MAEDKKGNKDGVALEERFAYYRRCQMVKDNGQQCKAPAKKGEMYCHRHIQESKRAGQGDGHEKDERLRFSVPLGPKVLGQTIATLQKIFGDRERGLISRGEMRKRVRDVEVWMETEARRVLESRRESGDREIR